MKYHAANICFKDDKDDQQKSLAIVAEEADTSNVILNLRHYVTAVKNLFESELP